ncbi:MAG: Gfo/Idh/MocA family oxidoreductase [Terriglobia bacterium]|jgi:predicted dehydrogenase
MLRRLLCVAHGLLPLAAIALLLPLSGFSQADSNEPIKVGIIGLDTSHVIAFTKALNDPSDKDHVAGLRVVAAYKGGSPDVESSWSRVDQYTAELRDKWQVEIVNDIPTLCSKVDAVLLESVDGRPHLEQVKPVFAAHKPVFIDKPMAGSYKDAKEIAALGKAAGVPWFTASSLRFWSETERLKNPEGIGHVLAFDVLGPTIREPHVPSLFWYGVHAVEMLYQLMGPGCESVTMQSSGNQDVVVGKWKDGRLGVVRGFSSGLYAFSITVYGDKGVLHSEQKPEGYGTLLVEIAKFFKTHVAPVDPNESLEVLAFMEAADLSKSRGGVAVPLSEIMQ